MDYNWVDKAEGYTDENGLSHYQNLVDEAKAEVVDLERRFELFARAEAWLIEEAMIIPYGVGGGGYSATKAEPFTAPYAPFGMDSLKWKGQIIMDKAMSMEEYKQARESGKPSCRGSGSPGQIDSLRELEDRPIGAVFSKPWNCCQSDARAV